MFTQEQLDAIKFAAKRTKNQGEIAVYDFVFNSNAFWTVQQWNILRYCAEECKRQRSGEMSVYDMVNAWNYAQKTASLTPNIKPTSMNLTFIEVIGRFVEPHDNAKGFRTIPIGVWDGYFWHEKAQWAEVPRLLEHLLASYYEGFLAQRLQEVHDSLIGHTAIAKRAEDQFYYEYENIHPFVDGNGRSGKILYNYLCGTLDNPIMPPNFWGGNP